MPAASTTTQMQTVSRTGLRADITSLGLFTEAKTRHDSILSAVEQRFLTHVYGPKICAGAPESEIAAALQEHVIDPLCASSEHGKLASSTILQALYYLTEQCHIQWDKP